MRTDVKLGLAVGGVLFGVVLAYVLVFSGGGDSGNQQQASNASDSGTSSVTETPATAAALQTPIIQTETPAPAASSVASGVNDAAPNGGTGAGTAAIASERRMEVSVGGTASDPATSTQTNGSAAAGAGTNAETATSSGSPTAQGTASSPANAGPWDWRRALEQGLPVPATITSHGQAGGTSQAIAASGSVGTSTGGPTTQPASGSGGKRNYIVKSGESFWSIAQREYGNANYLSHIARANPNINPGKLKAGMTIVLPAREDVVPAGAAAVSSAVAATPASNAAIDPAKEYRVQSGDNLTLIAKRLYGRTSRAAELYELNKELIGPNPSALKKNMVLKLPEAPTGAASTAAGNTGIAVTPVH